jgi:hypothetical protein
MTIKTFDIIPPELPVFCIYSDIIINAQRINHSTISCFANFSVILESSIEFGLYI